MLACHRSMFRIPTHYSGIHVSCSTLSNMVNWEGLVVVEAAVALDLPTTRTSH